MSTEQKSRRVSSVFFPACPRLTPTQQQLPQPGCGLVNNRWCCGLGIQHQKQRRSCLGSVMLMSCHYTFMTSGVHNLLLFHERSLVLLWNDRWPAFFGIARQFAQRAEFISRHLEITRKGSNYRHATFMAGISVSKKQSEFSGLRGQTDYDLLLNRTTVSDITVGTRARSGLDQALLGKKRKFIP